MAVARKFEELQVWQEARRLAGEIYALTERPVIRRQFARVDQMRRAALSSMNNIAEGFDSASNVEVRRFLRYAARSASEVQSCLYLCCDRGFIDSVELAALYDHAERVRRMGRALSARLDVARRSAPERHRVGEANQSWGDDWAPWWTDRPSFQATRTRAHARTH